MRTSQSNLLMLLFPREPSSPSSGRRRIRIDHDLQKRRNSGAGGLLQSGDGLSETRTTFTSSFPRLSEPARKPSGPVFHASSRYGLESHWRPAPGPVMINRNGGLPMNHSLLPSAAAALAAAFVFLSPAQPPIAAQTQAPATKAPFSRKAWTQPRTPDGQPDLQGYWTNNSITPWEGPRGWVRRNSIRRRN